MKSGKPKKSSNLITRVGGHGKNNCFEVLMLLEETDNSYNGDEAISYVPDESLVLQRNINDTAREEWRSRANEGRRSNPRLCVVIRNKDVLTVVCRPVLSILSAQDQSTLRLKAPNERRESELDKIFGILKSMCVIYDLLLAQTWVVSPSTNVVSNQKVLHKCCSNFDTKCIGKICISTVGLPFDVRDLHKWKFWEKSVKQHPDKSEGIVGRALASRGSYFCANITQLNKEEFPLVHYASKDNLMAY